MTLILSDTPSASQSSLTQSVSSGPRSPAGRGPRSAKRYGTQSTRLEAVDDALGPLGPLGDNAPATSEPAGPPVPPQKEEAPARQPRPSTANSQTSSARSMMDSVTLNDDAEESSLRPRVPPPVQPPSNEGPRRQTQPSVSVEQAAKPTFDITVGDAHKVGDLTSSHTVYSVRTKVSSENFVVQHFTCSLCRTRLHPKPITIPNSPCLVATVTSFGSTHNYITIILESWCHLHLKSRQSGVSIRLLLNRGEQLWSEC